MSVVIQLAQREPARCAGLRVSTSWGQLDDAIAIAGRTVDEVLEAAGLRAPEELIVYYDETTPGGAVLNVGRTVMSRRPAADCGSDSPSALDVPIADDVPSDVAQPPVSASEQIPGLVIFDLPGGAVATADVDGPYDELDAVPPAMQAWCREHSRIPVATWEIHRPVGHRDTSVHTTVQWALL
jgi:hypothetical protein